MEGVFNSSVYSANIEEEIRDGNYKLYGFIILLFFCEILLEILICVIFNIFTKRLYLKIQRVNRMIQEPTRLEQESTRLEERRELALRKFREHFSYNMGTTQDSLRLEEEREREMEREREFALIMSEEQHRDNMGPLPAPE